MNAIQNTQKFRHKYKLISAALIIAVVVCMILHNINTNAHTNNSQTQSTHTDFKKNDSADNGVKQNKVKTQLQTNIHVHNLAQYYIHLINEKTEDVSINTLFLLTSQSINEFASYIHENINNDTQLYSLKHANTIRQEIIKFFVRFSALSIYEQSTDAYKMPLLQRRKYMHKALNTCTNTPYITFTVDFVMLQLTRAAWCANDSVYDYILCSLTHAAYSPNIHKTHTRTTQQKDTVLDKLSLNNYTMGLLINAILFHSGKTLHNELRTVRVHLGHIMLVNLLSDTDYILPLFISQVSKYKKNVIYKIMHIIMHAGKTQSDDQIYRYLMLQRDRLISLYEQKDLEEYTQLLQQLQIQCIGKVLLIDRNRIFEAKVSQLLRMVTFLNTHDTQAILNTQSPLSIQAQHVLKYARKLENDLYRLYVVHHNLQAHKFVETDKLQLTNRMLHMSLQDFEQCDVHKLQQLLRRSQTSQNDELQYTDIVIEALDMCNKLQNVTLVEDKHYANIHFESMITKLLYIITCNV